MTVRFNPSRNHETDKKWLLRDLLVYTQELDNKLSKLESSASKIESLEYGWKDVTEKFKTLCQRQIAQESRAIFKDLKTVYSSLSFELINQPTK
tara:strand:- start:250 stop:531 length:282 start_codon:yes stop_codon:yes gene_type:complete